MATTTLANVQTQLLTILVGHLLEFDLKVLRACHPLYTRVPPPPRSTTQTRLAWLTKQLCNREIHLLRLKVQNGAAFGEFKTDHESIFERMARGCGRCGQAL